jgi:hypothetical protein
MGECNRRTPGRMYVYERQADAIKLICISRERQVPVVMVPGLASNVQPPVDVVDLEHPT